PIIVVLAVFIVHLDSQGRACAMQVFCPRIRTRVRFQRCAWHTTCSPRHSDFASLPDETREPTMSHDEPESTLGGAFRTPASMAATLIAGQIAMTAATANEELVELSRDDAQWVMPAKNYSSTRYSGLDQINTQNVQDLAVAWTFSIGTTSGFEAAPLVIGETMYVTTP